MSETDFLFAQPSFIGGLSAAADLGATLVEYNRSSTPEQADARAIASDWAVVGQDMQAAIGVVAGEINEK